MASHFREINPGRQEMMRLLSDAVRDSRTITIQVEGEKGVVTVRIQNSPVARFRDVYEAINALLPEYAGDFA